MASFPEGTVSSSDAIICWYELISCESGLENTIFYLVKSAT